MVSIGIRIGIPQGTGSGGGTLSPAVARPTITSPTEAAADQSLTLTLTSSAFAVTNEGTDTHASSDWQISDDSGFSNIVVESLADASNKVSYAVSSGLDPNTTYYARVQHNGTTYGASGWSAGVSFTTAYVDTPAITSPADAATEIGETPTITSDAFATTGGSDTHASTDWQIASDSSFNTIVVQSLADASNKTSWSVPGSNLLESTTYYLRVRYNGTAYGTSAWSPTIQFTTTDTFIVFDSDATAFIEAMATEPNSAVQAAINDLVTALKATTAGWSGADVIYIPRMPTLADSLLNLRNPATFPLTAVNSPTHTPYLGIAGNGSSSYLNTGWDPQTNGVNYTQNDCGIAIWLEGGTDTAAAVSAMGAFDGAGYGVYFQVRISGDRPSGRMQAFDYSFGTSSSVTTRHGWNAMQRVAASGTDAVEFYKDGSAAGTDIEASVSLRNYDFFLGGTNYIGNLNQPLNNQIRAAWIGSSLDATDQADVYDAFAAFDTAMAAAAP